MVAVTRSQTSRAATRADPEPDVKPDIKPKEPDVKPDIKPEIKPELLDGVPPHPHVRPPPPPPAAQVEDGAPDIVDPDDAHIPIPNVSPCH